MKNGTNTPAPNEVKDVPQGFKDWVAKNQERIKAAEGKGTLPWFLKDNKKWYNPAAKKVKTDIEKADIQARWNERAKKNALLIKSANNVLGVSKTYPEIDAALLKQLVSEGNMLKIQAETRTVAKAIAEVRKDDRYLSALIPDVRKWKEQFTSAELHTVYDAVESKLQQFSGLTLEKQLEKLEFEIKWVENNKKYDTWEVAKAAYQKNISVVETKIKWVKIDEGIISIQTYVSTSKSSILKKLYQDIEVAKNSQDIQKSELLIAEAQKKIMQLESKKIKGILAAPADEQLYTATELKKWNNYIQAYDKLLAANKYDFYSPDIVKHQAEMEKYILNLGKKYSGKQVSGLTIAEQTKTLNNLKEYLQISPINPNYIFGNNIGGVYFNKYNQRFEYSKKLNNVLTPDELSLLTRFTDGSTFVASYGLRNTTTYNLNLWYANKMAKLTASERIKITEIIEKYISGVNSVIDRGQRYNGYVYRGLKDTYSEGVHLRGASYLIDEFNRLWDSGVKEWINSVPVSTSTRLNVANIFDGKLIIQIRNKTGIWIREVSEYLHEYEVMTKAGTKYKILRKPVVRNGKTFVYLEEI